jgi:hypothetical protein
MVVSWGRRGIGRPTLISGQNLKRSFSKTDSLANRFFFLQKQFVFGEKKLFTPINKHFCFFFEIVFRKNKKFTIFFVGGKVMEILRKNVSKTISKKKRFFSKA